MRAISLVLLVAFSTVANAQPGGQPPVAEPAAVQLQLTAEQQQLLDKGEIPVGGWITGGVLSTFLGFGIGQDVQGRFKSRGWMFLVGDSVATTVALYGAVTCCGGEGHTEEYITLGGVAALIGLRIWQTLDAWLVPPAHNRKVRELRTRLRLAPPSYGLYLAPPQTLDGAGGVAGLSLTF